jgi:hypothetical protein
MSLAGFRRLLEAALAHHMRGNPYARGNAAPTGEALPYLGAKPGCRGKLRRSRPQDRTAPGAFPFSCDIKESRRPRTPGSVIVRRARKVIVVADSTKLGRRGFAPIAQSTLSRPWSPTREPTLPNSKPYADKGSTSSSCGFPDGPETWEIRVARDEFFNPPLPDGEEDQRGCERADRATPVAPPPGYDHADHVTGQRCGDASRRCDGGRLKRRAAHVVLGSSSVAGQTDGSWRKPIGRGRRLACVFRVPTRRPRAGRAST